MAELFNSPPEDGKRFGLRLSNTIEAGHIMQALVMAAAMGLIWAVQRSDSLDQTRAETKQFRVDVAGQMTGVMTQLGEIKKDIQLQAQQLPVMQQQVLSLSNQIGSLQQHLGSIDGDVRTLSERSAVLRSDVDRLNISPGRLGYVQDGGNGKPQQR